jgi:hypothetical protein
MTKNQDISRESTMWILIHRIFREFNMFLDVIGANEPGPFEGLVATPLMAWMIRRWRSWISYGIYQTGERVFPDECCTNNR